MTAVKHFSPFIIQSHHKTSILTDSKPCVQAFEKLCRGEFSNSPRVSTFLSVVSRYQASIRHLAGCANVPSDFGSRNAVDCDNPDCQICKFIAHTEDSVVRQVSTQDILSGIARLPFTGRASWATTQLECSDLRRTHAHLSQGTRPSKKSHKHQGHKTLSKYCHHIQGWTSRRTERAKLGPLSRVYHHPSSSTGRFIDGFAYQTRASITPSVEICG